MFERLECLERWLNLALVIAIIALVAGYQVKNSF